MVEFESIWTVRNQLTERSEKKNEEVWSAFYSFYTISWVPLKKILAQKLKQKQKPRKDGEEVTTVNGSTSPLDTTANRCYLTIAGVGGEGRNGILNAILLAEFDFTSNFLSELPVAKLGTEANLPYRMAVHPGGEGLICSLPKSGRWFEWDVLENKGTYKLDLISSEKVLTQLEDIGEQKAVTFNSEGSILVVGGKVQTVVRKAHLGFVTRLMFSEDSRALASASMDSSARLTVIREQNGESGGSMWIIVFIVLFAILVYFLKTN